MESNADKPAFPQIMTFYPTEDEFKNFNKYIEYMESVGAHKAGLAKVVPPSDWVPRRGGYEDLDVTIPFPIKQSITGSQGKYQQYNKQKKSMHIKEFQTLANSRRHRPPPVDGDMDALERKYWKNVCFNSAIYGADVPHSLYDSDQDVWNPTRLGTILDIVKEDYKTDIEGVTTTYLYFGMWKSSFPWHTEDMDLYSINYLHFGAPKFWYAVPTEYGRKLERVAETYFPEDKKGCANFLRHKSTLMSPSVLQQNNIPYNKIQQGPRDFIISFPYAYHSGFNTGYNCAESTNFATPRWIEYGKRAIHCDCRPSMVRFSMKCFVKRFQPDKLELFEKNLDIAPHPEDDFCNIHGVGPNAVRGIGRQVFSNPSYIIADPEEKRKMKMMLKRLPVHLEADKPKRRGRKRKNLEAAAEPSGSAALFVDAPSATTGRAALDPLMVCNEDDSTQGYCDTSRSGSDTEDVRPAESSLGRVAENSSLTFSGYFKREQVWVPAEQLEDPPSDLFHGRLLASPRDLHARPAQEGLQVSPIQQQQHSSLGSTQQLCRISSARSERSPLEFPRSRLQPLAQLQSLIEQTHQRLMSPNLPTLWPRNT